MSLVFRGASGSARRSPLSLKNAGRALGLVALCTLTPMVAIVGAEGGRTPAPAPGPRGVLAAQPSGTPNARYLDFDTPRGTHSATAHMQAAVQRVCRQMQDGDGIGSLTPYSICVHQALRDTRVLSIDPDERDGRSE